MRYQEREKEKEKDIIFGLHAINEAIISEKEIEKIFIKVDTTGNLSKELRQNAKERGIPVLRVPIEKINNITRKNHQGAVAFISPIVYQDIEEIINRIYESGETPLLLLLDKLTDVRNIGAIARTAEIAGIHAIIVPAKGSALISADGVKASAGALHTIPVCRVNDLYQTVDFLKESGMQIVSATEKTERLMYECDFTSPTIIVLGNEEKGITREIINKSDMVVKIPMFGKISSLNVSVAASVMIYEAVRQRNI